MGSGFLRLKSRIHQNCRSIFFGRSLLKPFSIFPFRFIPSSFLSPFSSPLVFVSVIFLLHLDRLHFVLKAFFSFFLGGLFDFSGFLCI